MSKLSHNKAVARHRRVKHGHCHRYTKKEMKALMPQFSGEKLRRYKSAACEFKIGDQKYVLRLDKNNQICDCQPRVGTIFSQLYGRVLSSDLNIVERIQNELDSLNHC